MSLTLYARELRRGVLPFFVIAAILTMYIVSVVYMYDPKITENLSLIMSTMPDAFAAFGMSHAATTMTRFMFQFLSAQPSLAVCSALRWGGAPRPLPSRTAHLQGTVAPNRCLQHTL